MSEKEYSSLYAAMEKLNAEAAKMAENQKLLLAHNASCGIGRRFQNSVSEFQED